ncbi:MAG: recombinase family protein [Peptococcaceae bacterium]
MGLQDNTNTIALYIRISLEDENKLFDTESMSISNQRNLLKKYVSEHEEFFGFKFIEFVDDGYTGTNFERPAFQSMIAQVRQGLIKTILVKDFSRFGRNYLEVGDYLEHIFPFLGVRIISINDNYDSANAIDTANSIDIAFRNILYDYYSKDLSKKVTSAMRVRQNEGKYVNTPPYGYIPDKDNKHHLVIDPPAAKIVQYIFNAVASGKSTTELAKELNAQRIPTPAQYKKRKTKQLSETKKSTLWDNHKILNILHNEKYTGTMINHKISSQKLRDRNPKRCPRDEWVIVPDSHEAIVTHEQFNAANNAIRKLRKTKKCSTKSTKNVFYCGYCGRKLEKHSRVSDPTYDCRNSAYQQHSDCSKIKFKLSTMETTLLEVFRIQQQLIEHEIAQQKQSSESAEHLTIKTQIDFLHKQLNALEVDHIHLYEKYKDRKLTKDEFIQLKTSMSEKKFTTQSEVDALTQKYETLCSTHQHIENAESAYQELIAETSSESELRNKMYQLIKRVDVYDEHNITIHWAFEDIFQQIIKSFPEIS